MRIAQKIGSQISFSREPAHKIAFMAKFSDFERGEVKSFEEYKYILKNFSRVAAKIWKFLAEMNSVSRLQAHHCAGVDVFSSAILPSCRVIASYT